MTTGDRIKQARKAAGLTQSELAAKVGVKFSAIHKYETNMIVNLKRETIAALAEALDVKPSWLMCMDEDDAPTIRGPVVPYKVAREIDPIYDALNASGQKELCRYGRYLGTQEEYRAGDKVIDYGWIPHFFTAAAAGSAAPIAGQEFEMIKRDENTPHGADYCIEIDGDSMEPYIHDGQRVYVKRDATDMREFEVGIFYVDGDVLCKQWCRDYAGTLHLLSANPKRQDANRQIRKNSGQHVVCFGKVLLGKKLPHPNYY